MDITEGHVHSITKVSVCIQYSYFSNSIAIEKRSTRRDM